MTAADPGKAIKAARDILAEFSVKAAPVQVERIIKSRKIVLQYSPMGEDLSGMAFIKDGVGIIGINALHHPNRQRFSAAHELAHHVLHAAAIRNAVHVDKVFNVLHRDTLASQGVDPFENEANAFAAELLMPQAFLVDAIDAAGLDIEDDDRIEALARKFRVSTSAMRYRLAGRF
jgi:Zn-dependent peptidase ImmA (M78 family)